MRNITEEEKNIIEKHLDEDRLKRIVRDTAIIAWDRAISENAIETWLSNFDGRFIYNVEYERKLALWLLSHFTFYTVDDIRTLCKELLRNFIHKKLIEKKIWNSIEEAEKILEETVFIGLGNASESGNNILYYFRLENKLPKGCFTVDLQKNYENVVFIDDVTISGSQALTYARMHKVQAQNQYIATLIATEKAQNEIADKAHLTTISAMLLDERDKAFAQKAHIFTDETIAKLKPLVKAFCEYYGKIASADYEDMKGYPLGYKDGQYLVGFFYNTPNNTLPIFWGEGNGWKPVFKRYPKIYSRKEWKLDEKQYY